MVVGKSIVARAKREGKERQEREGKMMRGQWEEKGDKKRKMNAEEEGK